jgi:aminoglycoside 6'-N-acetyltransferase I
MEALRIVEITRDWFPHWRCMREELYGDLSAQFHAAEMELIFGSAQATCFIGVAEPATAVAMLEVSLRNFVDGCLGGPVGYIEGLYVTPGQRHRGYARELTEFAAAWFRAKGCRDMAADAELTNVGAQNFFAKAGFDETYRIVEYKRSLKVT